jgi:VIT1/CCC1 family predicted Fe2+/Mn2+ transporter
MAANELALVYRAQGMSRAAAETQAHEVLRTVTIATGPVDLTGTDVEPDEPYDPLESADEHEAVGTGRSAAISSFLFFASGALLPVLPYLFGMDGFAAIILASVLVGVALLITGAIVGLLSGGPPLRRALRQLVIGFGAAAVTYLLGLAFGTTIA